VLLLHSTQPEVARQAASVLCARCGPASIPQLQAAGAVESLAMLLHHPECSVQHQAAQALWRMTLPPDSSSAPAPHDLPAPLGPVRSGLLACGAVPQLVGLLERPAGGRGRERGRASCCAQLQQVAARILTCLTYRTEARMAAAVVEVGAGPVLARLLHSGDPYLAEHGRQVLVNLGAYGAAESLAVRRAIAGVEGAAAVMVELLGRESQENQVEAARAIQHLCQERPSRDSLVAAGACSALLRLAEGEGGGVSEAVRRAALDALVVVGAEEGEGRQDRRLDSTTCSVCWERAANVVWVPCGHLCLCLHCAPGVEGCPICRSKGNGMRVYKP
jgi:hypothetical protein